MKSSISSDRTPESIAAILDLLAASPSRLEILSSSLPKGKHRLPLGKGERSFAEDVAHLINCEARSSEAIYLAILSNEPMLVDLHPERQFGRLTRFEQLPIEDLVHYFTVRRTVLLGVLRSLTDKQWSRTVREQGKHRKESVYWRARSIALHEVEHLSDVEGKARRLRSTA
jgi:hypothetical protein